MRSWTVLGVLSLLLLSTAFPMLTTSAPEPTRSLAMDPLVCVTPDVLVDMNTSVNSSFETMVGINDTVNEEVIVDLNATTDMDWSVTVVPDKITFTGPNAVKVKITVSVPAGTDSTTVAIVKLFGSAAFKDETVFANVYGYLYLKRAYGVKAEYFFTKRDPKEIWMTLNVYNTGNGEDYILVDVPDIEKLDGVGLSVTMSNREVVVPSHNYREVNIQISYDGNKALKYDLVLTVTSMYARAGGLVVEKNITVQLSFKGVDPPMQANIFAGVIVVFVIVIVIVLAVVLRGPSKKPR